jgi:hypothetical protein
MQARKGDFAERVAQNFGIPVEQLLNANFNINLLPATAAAAAGPQAKQLFGVPQDKPGAWLEGRLLKVCGARTPTAAPAAGPGPGEMRVKAFDCLAYHALCSACVC